ncbi:MAG: endonuclease III, partial [Clostridia bacterium]|nr:endonuclease III [Clostridia bacterium]
MRESLSLKKERLFHILTIFRQVYANADCTLDYQNALQLLIATQLAAQCTDARVNLVTPALFAKYPDVYAFANADELELQEDIRSTGFFRNKARNIIGCCQMLIQEFGGEVPNTMEALLRLPGVGRKTANLVLGDFFGIPGVVVDTHATRLSNRMGFTKEK